MNKLVEHVINSFEKSVKRESRINEDILAIEGMTGDVTRHFYNNICSLDGAAYLEVGSWKGSSICSAIYENNIQAVCIDNFSEFNDPSKGNDPQTELYANVEKFKGKSNVKIVAGSFEDCYPQGLFFGQSIEDGMPFNIFMYDGNHDEESQYRALTHFIEIMDDEFIFIVDDWNWDQVRSGTYRSFIDQVDILYEKEVRCDIPFGRCKGAGAYNYTNRKGWWNGIGIFVLKRTYTLQQ